MVNILSFLFFSFLWIAPLFAQGNEPEIKYFKTSDGLNIRSGSWTTSLPKKGTILLLQGMGGFIEGYQETAEQLIKRGYNVITFDWRGQGGSERVTNKPTLLHVNKFILYRRDLTQFIDSLVQPSEPLVILASSMGGHLALRYVHDHPEKVKAIITLAPMVEIKTGSYPKPIAIGLAKTLVFLGLGERFVFGFSEHEYNKCVRAYTPERDGNKERFLNRCEQLKSQPLLATGGPSFAWLDAAFHSCNKLNRATFAKGIKTPILMIIPEKDHLVSPEAQVKLCKNIPQCEMKIYPEAHHDVLREKNEVLEKVWQDIDEFLDKEFLTKA